jgi:methionyl-tRNA formyltransferase
LRLVFCGTPQFAVPSLKSLLAQSEIEVAAVITQPDRPKGRGQEISQSPVKQVAVEARVPVHQPQKIRAPEFQPVLEALAPDAIVIIAYGQIIPARLLTIPKLGWINLHASLLPKYRGAAPINWAIVNGETITGITTMRIDAGMDTGDMLLQQEIPIGAKQTAPELAARMSEAGAPLMLKTLLGLQSGAIQPQPQNHQQASIAPMLKKEDGCIDWNLSADQIFNRMRGFTPWPGATTTFRGQSCQVWGEPEPALEGDSEKRAEQSGTIHTAAGKIPELLVVCGTGLLRVTGVKLEARKQISPAAFMNGAHLLAGETFGT